MKLWNHCTIKEKLERLQQVKRVLKGLSKEKREKNWNMRYWGVITECGTVCCAAGHCGVDPWFRNRGFRLIPKRFNPNVGAGQGRFANDVSIFDFFGEQCGDDIFDNPKNRTVEEVILEINDFIFFIKEEIKSNEILRKMYTEKVNKEAKLKHKEIDIDLKLKIKKINQSFLKNLSVI